MTKEELITRAISIASRGLEPSLAPFANTEPITEDLLESVFASVSGELAGDPDRRSFLRRAQTLTFVVGIAALDQTVLTDYLCESILYDEADPTAVYSYYPDRHVFQTDHEIRLGRYHVDESTIEVVSPNTTWVLGGGPSVDLVLLTPRDVAVPALPASAIVARDEVVDLLLTRLVAAIAPGRATA